MCTLVKGSDLHAFHREPRGMETDRLIFTETPLPGAYVIDVEKSTIIADTLRECGAKGAPAAWA